MKNKGFTLIQTLMVVIIIGIVASIAIPMYQKAAENSHKAEATSTLSTIWAAEKRYHIDNKTYTGRLDELDIDIPASAYYAFSIASATADDFTARAQRMGSGQNYTITINAAGDMQESAAPPVPGAVPQEFIP